MNPIFEKKISDFKNRLLKRKYELSQYNHANGIWIKLRWEIELADKIYGMDSELFNKKVKNGEIKHIGLLSSLNKDMDFYTAENLLIDNGILLERDINKIINSKLDKIIFIHYNS